jgi:hypothetical protein
MDIKQGKTPKWLRMELMFTSEGCDNGRLRDRGYHAESSVMLDYIDPNVVPTTKDWHFFGCLTPWSGQPEITGRPRHDGTTDGGPRCFVNGHTAKS